MDKFAVEVGRNRTASGYEWFLLADGERVQTNASRTGIFTSTGLDTPRPEEMLPRLLARLIRFAGSEVA